MVNRSKSGNFAYVLKQAGIENVWTQMFESRVEILEDCPINGVLKWIGVNVVMQTLEMLAPAEFRGHNF